MLIFAKRALKVFSRAKVDILLFVCLILFTVASLNWAFSRDIIDTPVHAAEPTVTPSKVVVVDMESAAIYQNSSHIAPTESVTLNKDISAIFTFKLPSLQGKVIQNAYVSMTNQRTTPSNSYRTVEAYPVKAPAASGQAPTIDWYHKITDQTVFRNIGWDTPWLLNITPYMKTQHAANSPSLSVAVRPDDELGIFLTKPTLMPYLVIEYSDAAGIGAIPNDEKLRVAANTLQTRYLIGPWSWMSVGVINAQTNYYKQGLSAYKNNLLSFLGREEAIQGYYQAPFGIAMMEINPQLYTTRIEQIRDLFRTLPKRDGILLDNNTIQTELAYLGLPFLAEYGSRYADTAATGEAVTEAILLYDMLMKDQTDGIPYTLISLAGSKGKGWSRGVGWLFGGMGKLIANEGVKKHPQYAALVNRYRALAKTLKPLQHESGLWYSVVHNAFSELETTGTALMAIGYQYGIQNGILHSSDYGSTINKARLGLLNYSKSGTEMSAGFPSNLTLDYSITQFSNSRCGFGLWMELESLLK